MSSSHSKFVIGIDGGGTHCRAVVFSPNGEILANAVSGPANVSRDFKTAQQSITEAAAQALAKLGLSDLSQLSKVHVFAGLAGTKVSMAQQQLSDWRHPFAEFKAVSDLHAATLGAHDGKNGAVLIVGTGSSAAAITDGEVTQYGGHGFLLGDKGSGAWIGLQAIKHTLIALDGLTNQIESSFTLPVIDALRADSTDQIVSQMINQPPAVFAQLAPLIMDLAENDEPTAKAIVKDGASYLSAIALRAITQTQGELCLIGGLSQRLKPWLDNQVQASIINAIHGPEWGAVLAARSIST